ncbi:unnamed protein product, partial [Amoebophrya sp. A25]
SSVASPASTVGSGVLGGGTRLEPPVQDQDHLQSGLNTRSIFSTRRNRGCMLNSSRIPSKRPSWNTSVFTVAKQEERLPRNRSAGLRDDFRAAWGSDRDTLLQNAAVFLKRTRRWRGRPSEVVDKNLARLPFS